MGDTYTEATLGTIISTKITTTVTSVPPGNDQNSSFSNQFSYIVSNIKNFAVTLALTTSILGLSQEEAISPQMLYLVGIDILYYSIIQHRPLSTADSMAIDETESIPSTMLVIEQIESQYEPTKANLRSCCVFSSSYY